VSLAGDLLFIVSSVFAVGGAIGTVAARNPLRAAVALLVHILALGAIFLTLYAQLLAALQLLVYAGAVVVLFVFVIMMIGPEATPDHGAAGARDLVVRTISFGLMAILTGAIAFTLATVDAGKPPRFEACAPGAGAECGQFGGVKALGRELYGEAAVPFELVSILLLVGVVGSVAVARGRTGKEAEAVRARRAARAAAGEPATADGAAE
jgi:NADH-quinone oxidoreductase subunit J